MQPDASPIPLFREIHKNAWLKKVVFANNTKILSGNQKKSANERWWIVFCVHGDVEPYLEGYSDTATATAHVPRWKISLKHTLHVSGSVGPARPHTEYEFVITLQEGIVRLIAPTWETMQDWVDTLRNKLREMKIISPKENVYSKGPEQSKPRAPTRDPTSPLPPPPPGPIIRVPGTEPSIRPIVGEPQEDEVPGFSVTVDCTNNSNEALVNENGSSENSVESQRTIINQADFASSFFDFDNFNINQQSSGSNITISEASVDGENTDNRDEILPTAQHTNIITGKNNVSATNESHLDDELNVNLSLDAYFLKEASKVNISKNMKASTSKGSDFLSNIANVSGMNICLGDSVLEEMMKNGNNSMFSNFGSSENSLNSQSENNQTKSDNKDVKVIVDKYSKVDLSKKSNKANKGSKTLISIEPNDIPSVSGQSSSKIKPKVLPRKIMSTEKHYVNSSLSQSTDDNQQTSFRVNDDRNNKPDDSTSSIEGPNSLVNNVSLNCNDESVSNVTIIKVANSTTISSPSTENENQPTNIQPSDKDANPEKSEDGVYANLAKNDFKSNTKLTLKLDNNDSHLSTSGYGHIRHTTTVGLSPNEGAYENTKCTVVNLNSSTSNPVSQSNEMKSNQKVNFEKHNNVPKIRNINNVEISISTDGGLSIQNGSPSISTIIGKHAKNVTKPSSVKPNSSDEFYDSVFTPFSIPNVSSNLSDNVSSTSIPVVSDSANKPVSSVFYVEHPNPTASNKIDKNSAEYEFLFWNESNNPHMESVLNIQTNPTESENNTESKDIELATNPHDANIENCPQAASKLAASAKSQKHGLFTRGLTEFSLMSKFRHPDNQNSPKLPLLQNSQFYSYEEMECSQGNSSSETKPVEDHSKKGVFTSKFNNIFHLNDDKANANKTKVTKVLNPLEKVRVESSLRRNWSERNDRIVLPIVKTNAPRNLQNTQNVSSDNSSRNPLGEMPSNEDQPNRRRSNSLTERRLCNESNSVAPTNSNSESGPEPILLRPMSLREQQVARLRGEMAHSGGVRLRLRSGDSPGDAMAMADVYGTVWICGWKQKTHPLLYNALHIGDRLATIGGVPITSVRQAKRALKETSSGQHYVELVIKRLPHGKVYVINRDFDSQDLGFILDAATIVGIIPNSLAARTGIPASGTLTEINGRPLNLILKKGDTQVRDRLNAIGKDVSILIQPTEFVALLKSALRNMRGHKDYIVQ